MAVEPPKWAEDFPVDADQDAGIARRDFIRFLFLVSMGLFTGTAGVFIKGLFKKKEPAVAVAPLRIAGLQDLEVGGSYVFQLPDRQGPAILIRLADNQFVAYSQKCTHLQCPVLWNRAQAKLLCPCHHGAFSVQTGDVLYGPPERPLPKIRLALKPDGIYYEGMEPLA